MHTDDKVLYLLHIYSMPKSGRCRVCSSTTDSETLQELMQPQCDRIQGNPLNIIINRRAILRSVQLALHRPEFSFTRPAQIHFAGEDAVDDGGPRREFFRCVFCIRHLLVTVNLQ